MSSAEASHAAREILASEGLAGTAPSPTDELAARKAAALAEVEVALAGAQASAKAVAASEATQALACDVDTGFHAAGAVDKGSKVPLRDEEDQSSQYKLFLGGLPWSCDESILRRDFSECGKIDSLRLLTDRETGQSRGMAFITFTDVAGFEAALKYNGDDYGGRTLTVAKAEGKGGRGWGKGKGTSGGSGRSLKPMGCTSVIVKGLAYEATEEELRRIFCKCGRGPKNIKILIDRETGESRGTAFIDFDDDGAVDEAMKMSETELRGRAFFVDYAKPRR